MKENGKESRIPKRVLEFSDYLNKIPFEEAEKHIAATKEKDNSYEVFDKLGIDEALRDSLHRATSISNKGDFFSLAYHFTKGVFTDTLTDASNNKYPLLMLRFYGKKYLEDRDDILDLVTIRNRKEETVFTRAYVHTHCSFLDSASLETKPLDDSIWIVESTGAGACAMTVTVEQYSDTLILSNDTIRVCPWQGDPA